MKHATRPRWPYLILILPLALLGSLAFLQGPFVHTHDVFSPDYPQVDLTSILAQETLSEGDYDLLFAQTGLSPTLIDAMDPSTQYGTSLILELQEWFFTPTYLDCVPIFNLLVREDRMVDEQGERAWAPPLFDLQPGDIILSFSTHSVGWRHGHAGLVISTQGEGQVLEAMQIGSTSTLLPISHWQAYSNYAVLRLKEGTPEEGQAIADYALEHLLDVPYHLTSGVFGDKMPDPDSQDFGVQCDYLVWYPYAQFGYDIDGDGGKIVTTADIFASPLLEVVQFYGMDVPTNPAT